MAEGSKKLEGIVVFYVNVYPDLGQQIEPTILMIKEMNKALIHKLSENGKYVCLLVPTFKEGSRIEKVDYEYPFPRYAADSVDVEKEGLVVKKKKPNLFIEEDAIGPRGIVSLSVNFHPELKLDVDKILKFIMEVNADAIKRIVEDGTYQIMFVPTTKEGTRIEKIDYDSPFPRFVTKNKKQNPMQKLVSKVEDDDEEEEETDEEEVEEEDEE